MTRYRTVSVACANCGETQDVVQVVCTNEHGASDLDTRPPREHRSTMHTWAVMCKVCGYCTNDITWIEAPQKMFMQTPQYRQELQMPQTVRPVIASIFMCASLLDEVQGNLVSACWNALRAAWCCDDMEGARENPYMLPRHSSPSCAALPSIPQTPLERSEGEAMDESASCDKCNKTCSGTEIMNTLVTKIAKLSPPDSKRQLSSDFEEHSKGGGMNFNHVGEEIYDADLDDEYAYDDGLMDEQGKEEEEEEEKNEIEETNNINGNNYYNIRENEYKEEEWSLTEYFKRNCANRYNYEPYLFQLDKEIVPLFYDPEHFNQSKRCRMRAIYLLEQIPILGMKNVETMRTTSFLDETLLRKVNAPIIDKSLYPHIVFAPVPEDQNMKYDIWIQLIIDMLRRIGQFDTAGYFICDLRYKGSNITLKKILKFQLKLCKEKDSGCHTFAEVF